MRTTRAMVHVRNATAGRALDLKLDAYIDGGRLALQAQPRAERAAPPLARTPACHARRAAAHLQLLAPTHLRFAMAKMLFCVLLLAVAIAARSRRP